MLGLNDVRIVWGRIISAPRGGTAGETQWAAATVVYQRPKSKGEGYEDRFVTFKGFGKTAESMMSRMEKGSMVIGIGSSQIGRKWENKDGDEVTPDELVLASWQVIMRADMVTAAFEAAKATRAARNGDNDEPNAPRTAARPAADPDQDEPAAVVAAPADEESPFL